MEVPDAFQVVESGLYRARSAPEYAFPFLASLRLKTMIVLDSGTPSRSVTEFAATHNINVVHLVTESWRPIHDVEQQHLTTNLLSDALEYVLDQRNYPVIILGINLLTGVIRKLENWALYSVLNDYTASSTLSGARAKAVGSVYLEFLQFSYGKEELQKESVKESEDSGESSIKIPYVNVRLPAEEFRPDWVRRFKIGSNHLNT